MRNTQPLLAGSPLGGRMEWKGPSLQTAETPAGPFDRTREAAERFVVAGLAPLLKLARRIDGVIRPVTVSSRAGHKSEPATVRIAYMAAKAEAQPWPRWKRFMDLALVLPTMPLWLGIMILVTFWIRLVSPGPTFYKQERIGHGGRRFMILKFRSMRVNVETRSHEQHFRHLVAANAPMSKLDALGDPRMILGGRLLRALGLDELPQLINVLRGEMSLVGPRPCTPKEFEYYEPWHRERVKVPPGLTGFWQVNGKNKTTFTEMIAMDVFYADHMSLCLDFEIVLKTVAAVSNQAIETNRSARSSFPVSHS
jgi:lipopolysaccharide/colanic/teichoic acid biosynthesis glycosyltransferase